MCTFCLVTLRVAARRAFDAAARRDGFVTISRTFEKKTWLMSLVKYFILFSYAGNTKVHCARKIANEISEIFATGIESVRMLMVLHNFMLAIDSHERMSTGSPL
jgi:hypothetical protein